MVVPNSDISSSTGPIEWLASIENEEKRAELTKTGFGRWAHLDPIASEHWLTSTDLTPDHDPALIQFSEDHSSREPEKALIWAGRIQDNGLRGTAQANVLFRNKGDGTVCLLYTSAAADE